MQGGASPCPGRRRQRQHPHWRPAGSPAAHRGAAAASAAAPAPLPSAPSNTRAPLRAPAAGSAMCRWADMDIGIKALPLHWMHNARLGTKPHPATTHWHCMRRKFQLIAQHWLHQSATYAPASWAGCTSSPAAAAAAGGPAAPGLHLPAAPRPRGAHRSRCRHAPSTCTHMSGR